ncbi:hypothetical protein [Aeromonas schubertii]
MLEIKLGRYDSNYCVEQFEAGQPQIIGQEAIWAFDLNEEEFEVYIPALDGQPDTAAFASAKKRNWGTHRSERRVAANRAAICHPDHCQARYCRPLQDAEVS